MSKPEVKRKPGRPFKKAPFMTVVWEPQVGPQTLFVTCPVEEIFFGGARGGGKTDAVLGEWISHASLYKSEAVGLMVRRSRIELTETIERSKTIYRPLGWVFNEQDKMWRSSDGARLRFAYLERDSDADGYQGHSYTRVYVEEIGNFPSPKPIMKLFATLRSGTGVPVGFRATGNPGGAGHNWVRERYITPAPGGLRVIQDPGQRPRVFIPSRLKDNKYLGADYVERLRMTGSEQLVKAWLDGDWDAIEGAFFTEWSTRNIVPPFEIPVSWLKFRSADWGFAAPFSIGWWAIPSESYYLGESGVHIPRGALVRYREWYGAKSANVGLRLTAEEVAWGVKHRSGSEEIAYTVVDPSMYAEDGGPSLSERFFRAGIGGMRRGDNKRVASRGALGGWDQMRARMKGDGIDPALFVFDTCVDFIRTVPVLQHDPDKPEDLDTEAEDHVADESRYACMSRPYIRQQSSSTKARKLFMIGDGNEVSLDDLFSANLNTVTKERYV